MSLFRKFVEFEMIYTFLFLLLFFSLLFSIDKRSTFAKFLGDTGAADPDPTPPFPRASINISNVTCQDCLRINWLLIKMKGIYKILTPVSFVGRNAKCSCFIYSNMFQQQFYKKWKWFSSLFYHPLPFFCPAPSLI